MRILLVKSFARPTSVGELALGLARRGHEVHVALPRGNPGCDELSGTAIAVHYIDALAPCGGGKLTRMRHNLQLLRALWRLFRSRPFDVIHLNLARARLYGRLAAATLPHGVVVSSIRGFEHKYERWSNWLDHRTVAVSDAVRRYLIANGATARKIVTIQNGVAVSPVESAEPDKRDRQYLHRELAVAPQVRLVGMVGFFRAGGFKGHTVFLDAARRVREAEPDVHFVLVGSDLSASGHSKQQCERHAKDIGIDDVVHFLGGRTDIFPIMRSLSVHVLPSFREGCPMVVLEAMACGTPTVSSRIEAISEIIEDGRSGILFEPGDHQALAAEIVGLLRDPAKAGGIATAAHRRVQARYSTEQMTCRYEDLFHELVHGHAERGAVRPQRA